MKIIKFTSCTFFFLYILVSLLKAQPKIPGVYKNLVYGDDEVLYYQIDIGYIPAYEQEELYPLAKMMGNPKGTKTGLIFNFKNKDLNGTLYYGFIPYGDSKHPYPVYFHSSSQIREGKAEINILSNLSGKYDMVEWQKNARGTLGYRILNEKGEFIYDGKITFKGTGPFDIDHTIIEGPFINLLQPDGATISFTTNFKSMARILVNKKEFFDKEKTKIHEIEIVGLKPGTEYKYAILLVGGGKQTFSFKTAPEKGSRKPFIFAYCSDSRNGQGGGERNLFGANYYIMKKIMALTKYKDARFMQFSGDLIDGYLVNESEIDLQYANWKRSVEPFAHYLPVYTSMGNHEVLLHAFVDTNDCFIRIDKFPFDKNSAEAVFARNFVNPVSELKSEDGAYYDPNENMTDFPGYEENVYYYSYDNIAMLVLNSNYLFAPDLISYQTLGGNLHGYIMDNQLKWLENTLYKFENDSLVDHIFVTLHTPAFPNGGHVTDDMWYNGNNAPRPYINGNPVKKGIIERRDEFLDIIINKNSKVVALLTGDEHNYNRLRICKEMPKYPENWRGEKLEITRDILQINNGAAGAPYYAQEQTPWTEFVSGFTTQNAVVFIYVDGEKVWVEVLNPDTLELVDKFIISK